MRETLIYTTAVKSVLSYKKLIYKKRQEQRNAFMQEIKRTGNYPSKYFNSSFYREIAFLEEEMWYIINEAISIEDCGDHFKVITFIDKAVKQKKIEEFWEAVEKLERETNVP